MGDRGHVGVSNPDGTITIRYVHSDAGRYYLPHAIARIWWHTFARDTDATIAALLAHDWHSLNPNVTATTGIGELLSGGIPQPGVGLSIPQLPQSPATGRADDLFYYGEHVYLLDPTQPTTLLCTTRGRVTGHPRARMSYDLRRGEHVVIE